jgi:hypothetical protein
MKYTCSLCKEEITEKEFNYSTTRFNKPLCREHQNSVYIKQSSSEIKSEPVQKKDTEIKSNDWVFNLIKGRIAETMVEALFIKLGFNVFRFGMENTIPGIMELLCGVKDDVANEIKRMPDFVIHKDGKAHFIEVKFRKSESFSILDLEEKKKGEYPFQNALFILVSKKHIKCISYMELKRGDEITPTCRNYLGSREEFEVDKETIIEYCKYAVKFFETV